MSEDSQEASDDASEQLSISNNSSSVDSVSLDDDEHNEGSASSEFSCSC